MQQNHASGPACSLDAHAFRDRVRSIAAFNARALRDQKRTGLTLVLTYASEAGREVEHLVAKEADCCGFLNFRTHETDAGIVLTITVPADQADDADRLLAPFDGTDAQTLTSCCGAC